MTEKNTQQVAGLASDLNRELGVIGDELPAPRLELLWKQEVDNWFTRICEYVLVLPLGKHDIRRETETGEQSELRITIGETRVCGGKGVAPIFDGKVDTPYRDHSHALWDSRALGGLPIFAVCGNIATKIDT